MINEKAKWIWRKGNVTKNEFVRFEDSFDFCGGKAFLKIAAETDYIAYVNGREVAFGQYAGYPDLKFYDETDISEYCREGENTLSLTVRYEGLDSSTHIDDGAGVIYAVESGDRVLAHSSEKTLSLLDSRYVSGEPRFITVQLGYAADMRVAEAPELMPSVVIEKSCKLVQRPVKKTVLGERKAAREIREGLYDLGCEDAGYLYVKYKSDKEACIKVAYGEHIADGCVRYLIAKRNFSLDFYVTEGAGELCQKFIRIAGRYLEVFAPEGVTVNEIGIIPVRYPLTERAHSFTGLDKDIYETCVRTLRLCMNTHYEDCPWREQALYVLDSKNQMLTGYYAFEESEFQRANLVLISHGVRDDGFLELTFPAKGTPAIPFFSLMYPVTVLEYIEHTGDAGILDEVFDTALGIMTGFKNRIEKDRLIREFPVPYWNFYEWTEGSTGAVKIPRCHLILNCALVYAYERFKKLCDMRGVKFEIDTDAIKNAILSEFYHPETGLFHLSDTDPEKYSELGQAFALLIGLGDERTAAALTSEGLIPVTLSAAGFVYDALLKSDPKNAEFILADIRKKYGYMLDRGATTFWETIEGESAFNKAGSLCHGWSALPVYYLKELTNPLR
ncbi:MAG: hypothetical protein IKB38_03395 [Clostridia bacterium]|nr:hypothetical protein [Clostridia bacterium]